MTKPVTEDLPAMEGPGVGQKKIAKVEKAARMYVHLRDDAKELKEKLDIAKDVLVDALLEHDIKLYRHNDFEIEVTTKHNVKIRGINDDEQNDDTEN